MHTNRISPARKILSWLAATVALALLSGCDTVTLTKVTSDHFRTEYFAPRPDSEKLDDLRLTLRGLNRMRDWRESLADYVRRHDWNIRL